MPLVFAFTHCPSSHLWETPVAPSLSLTAAWLSSSGSQSIYRCLLFWGLGKESARASSSLGAETGPGAGDARMCLHVPAQGELVGVVVDRICAQVWGDSQQPQCGPHPFLRLLVLDLQTHSWCMIARSRGVPPSEGLWAEPQHWKGPSCPETCPLRGIRPPVSCMFPGGATLQFSLFCLSCRTHVWSGEDIGSTLFFGSTQSQG